MRRKSLLQDLLQIYILCQSFFWELHTTFSVQFRPRIMFIKFRKRIILKNIQFWASTRCPLYRKSFFWAFIGIHMANNSLFSIFPTFNGLGGDKVWIWKISRIRKAKDPSSELGSVSSNPLHRLPLAGNCPANLEYIGPINITFKHLRSVAITYDAALLRFVFTGSIPI